jgi:hypothetical protein
MVKNDNQQKNQDQYSGKNSDKSIAEHQIRVVGYKHIVYKNTGIRNHNKEEPFFKGQSKQKQVKMIGRIKSPYAIFDK